MSKTPTSSFASGGKIRLKDKVAIITGAARGIGKETALLFAAEGAKVVIADVDEDGGKQVEKEILDQKGEALFVRTDVTDFSSAKRMAKACVERFGRVDILVNNAGIIKDKTLRKMEPEEFEAVINVNLKGVFNCTKAVVDYMVSQGSGVILNASSVVALYGNFGQTNYVASKCGVIGMTKVWARELGPKGIRVVAVAPGFVETDMTSQLPDEVKKLVVERTPLRRMATPQEIARVYLFLASNEASFITGTVISVDGGLTL